MAEENPQPVDVSAAVEEKDSENKDVTDADASEVKAEAESGTPKPEETTVAKEGQGEENKETQPEETDHVAENEDNATKEETENIPSETAPEGDEIKETDEAGENEEQKKEPEDKSPDETKPDEEKTEEAVLPTSEGFAEGEGPEAPIKTGDNLSREATPVPDVVVVEELRATSPEQEKQDDTEQEEIAEEQLEIIPQFNRDELIEKYHAAISEREQLNQRNRVLQHKLAEYFRRKKTEENRQEVDRNVTDQEQRYLKYMSNLEELRHQEAVEKESYNEQIEEMKLKRAEKQLLVEEECRKEAEFKRNVALSSINSRSGRPLTLKDIEVYEQAEEKKEAEVSQVRLENIKLRNRLRKREIQLKQKEELAEGLHLIDFEQLKIENQTYNEKIEERNEELMKLRKKITSTVQVLTHLKEKLQFVQGENHSARLQLSEVEQEVAKKRDVLSRTKQARDALRHDNSKLQESCGLLGNKLLLRDYEEGKDESDDLRHKLDIMKRTHAELTLSLSGVKKKIDQARIGQM